MLARLHEIPWTMSFNLDGKRTSAKIWSDLLRRFGLGAAKPTARMCALLCSNQSTLQLCRKKVN